MFHDYLYPKLTTIPHTFCDYVYGISSPQYNKGLVLLFQYVQLSELDNLKCLQSFEHVKHISLPTSEIGGISYLAVHHHAKNISAPTGTLQS